ncbi:MAG: hypothetical protein DMG54_24755 [Acidobacteria bacterium]|nr:MAG: hypothetical protein DMG54_24755 [Acidobacteriota bacterium]
MKCHFDFEFEGLLERKRMRPVLVTLAPLAKLAVIVLFLQTAASSAAGQSPTPSLDFEYYRARVEPIFLKKRRQFTSQDDPDWRALADWVRNAKIHASTTP